MGIMDYSILVGIHHIPVQGSARRLSSSTPKSSRGSQRNAVRRRLSSADSVHSLAGSGPLAGAGAAGSGGLIGNSVGSNISDGENSSNRDVALHGRKVDNPDYVGSISTTIYDEIIDEDDSSYLEGSDKRNPSNSTLNNNNSKSPHRNKINNNNNAAYNEECEKKKQQTIERIYWPFHRLYDIHGNRLMKVRNCHFCTKPLTRCICPNDGTPKNLGRYFDDGLPGFVPPLSERKDGGFTMDTTGFDFPKMYKSKNSPRADFIYDGKIFYMGIIDILQEFTYKKDLEARYRALSGSKFDASCVEPEIYSKRFVRFFDQYTQRDVTIMAKQKQNEQVLLQQKLTAQQETQKQQQENANNNTTSSAATTKLKT